MLGPGAGHGSVQFIHKLIANGLTLSTCPLCQKFFASPTPAGIALAEKAHRCERNGVRRSGAAHAEPRLTD